MVKMKQKVLGILFLVGFIYMSHFHPLWIIIPFTIIAMVLLLLLIWGLRETRKHEKEVRSYLDECDEKLKKGEMTKEENDEIHFYWECENWADFIM